MNFDIVIPKGNEKDFIRMGKRLGYSKLIFLYKEQMSDFTDPSFSIEKRIIGTKADLRRGKALYVRSDENDRAYFESNKVECIFELEKGRRGDFIHHRNSGLNQVLCILAKKKGIAIGFSFHLVLADPSGKVLGRMMQNAILCKKYGVKFHIASFARTPYEMRSPADMVSFGSLIGFHVEDSKSSFNS